MTTDTATPQLLKKSNPTKYLLLLAGLFGAYYYSDVMLHYSDADAECLKFAEKADIKPAFKPDPDDKKIFVANKWIKNGYVVVELGQKVAADTPEKKGHYQSRICVIGGGQIRIPSMFEQWQYR